MSREHDVVTLSGAEYDALLSEAEDAARLREELAALRAAPAAEPVSVKPLEWVEDHGISGMGPYRLFYAVTPLGRFVYGTYATGDAYWRPPSSGVYTADSEEAAKRAAERSWEKYALAEAGKFLRLAAGGRQVPPLSRRTHGGGTMTRLLPCPFCGSPAEIERGSDYYGEWFNLGCSRHWGNVPPERACIAGRMFYMEDEHSEDEAAALWNTRAALKEGRDE